MTRPSTLLSALGAKMDPRVKPGDDVERVEADGVMRVTAR
jgi:hypothetical protein